MFVEQDDIASNNLRIPHPASRNVELQQILQKVYCRSKYYKKTFFPTVPDQPKTPNSIANSHSAPANSSLWVKADTVDECPSHIIANIVPHITHNSSRSK